MILGLYDLMGRNLLRLFCFLLHLLREIGFYLIYHVIDVLYLVIDVYQLYIDLFQVLLVDLVLCIVIVLNDILFYVLVRGLLLYIAILCVGFLFF